MRSGTAMPVLYIGSSRLPTITSNYGLNDHIQSVKSACNDLFGHGVAIVQTRFENGHYIGLSLELPDSVASSWNQNEPIPITFPVPFKKHHWVSQASWSEDSPRPNPWSGARERDDYRLASLELGYLLEPKDRFVTKWPLPPDSKFISPKDAIMVFNFQRDDRHVMIEYQLLLYKFRMKILMSNILWMLLEQDHPKDNYTLVMQIAVAPIVTYIEAASGKKRFRDTYKRYAVPHEAVRNTPNDNYWKGMLDILRPCIKSGPPSGRYFVYRLELSIKPDEIDFFYEDMNRLNEVGLLPKVQSPVLRALNPEASYTPLSKFLNLPYKIYFQIAALAGQNEAVLHMMTPEVIAAITPRPLPGEINPESATPEQLKDHADEEAAHNADVELISAALKRMASGFRTKDKAHLYTFTQTLELEKKNEQRKMVAQQKRRHTSHDVNYRWIHKIIVTPTAVHYVGPQFELINRVIRDNGELLDNFLRVQFCDEDHDRMTATNQDLLLRRISAFLDKGIAICNKKFEFLHYSSSQQRNAGCWFYSPPDNKDKPIQCPHGPMFFSNSCNDYRIDAATGARYLYFDGVGRIGKQLGGRLWSGLSKFMPHMAQFGNPTAFQLRIAGAKGMLSVDESMAPNEIHLRPNMIKFEKDYYVLEVVRTAFYSPSYLNRQLILLLLAHGISQDTFLTLMEEQVRRLDSLFTNKEAAKSVLKTMIDGWGITNELLALIDAGFWDRKDPYLMNLLRLHRACQMREIKKRTRIHVPEGVHLLGVMDETGLLPEDQIIVRYSEPRTNSRRTVVGRGIVTRAPCLHPGDVQIVTATDEFDRTPNLSHHRDVIVFSKRGVRPLPNKLAGGDLDGDSFIFIWDKRLVPKETEAPMDYTPANERTFKQIGIQDVKAHFVDFIAKNTLGKIDHAHMAWADKEGAKSERCRKLAELHSVAVDFAKSGVAADFPEDLEPRQYPHWLEKKGSRSYISRTVIGTIYDKVTVNVNLITQIEPDPLLLIEGRDKYLSDAVKIKKAYDREIITLMNQYGVTSELEIISSYILMIGDGRKKPFEINDDVMPAINALKKRYRAMILPEQYNASAFKEPNATVDAQVLAKASAWYEVTYSIHFNKGTPGYVKNNGYSSSADASESDSGKIGFVARGAQEMDTDVLTLRGRMISFCWILSDLLSIILTQQLRKENGPKSASSETGSDGASNGRQTPSNGVAPFVLPT
ncbi:hypothetical protein SeMB42_g07729 [Synchytrium endobioticum]|uniref:RNA-dependent RNA polymerase n=1 Tax=Synchytrium endobioticum TaxID=286115 RepID=A0A507BXQ2_9FUNG|nr:hypothetical protein SeMB42_g07729 [Synchytrium endobioticum]